MKNRTIFDLVDGLKPVDPKDLEEYERAMDDAIPQMVSDHFYREQLAQQARDRNILLFDNRDLTWGARLRLANGVQI